ncbi:hypothetical protein [Okeania sp.]|uniref:hypothetical protein n=1 Tax=Okeania sp. TaxID=3100323 RepID=UPI002B4B4999|nr:hypothetical protein [Okeania sp.]
MVGLFKIHVTKITSDLIKGIMVMSEILTPDLVAQVLTVLGSIGFVLLAIQALRALKQ